jgi:hypothetical protein
MGYQGDPSHIYRGKTQDGNDIWSSWDGNRWVEWTVAAGDDSRNAYDIRPGNYPNPNAPANSQAQFEPPAPVNQTPAPVTQTTPVSLAPVQGNPRHTYIRTDSGGDLWQVTDEGGNVIRWYVRPGDNSNAALPGTFQNLGRTESTVTVANPSGGLGAATNSPPPAPVSNPPPNTTTPATNTATLITGPSSAQDHASVASNPLHKYQGSDGTFDFWNLRDEAGNLVGWKVLIGHPSGDIYPGSLQNFGGALNSVTTRPATVTPPPAGGGGNVTTTTGTGGGGTNGTAGGTNLKGAPLPADAGKASDPRHKYVGRDARGDVWQLFDGVNVVEWAVKIGDQSGAVINSSLRNLGPPSANTVAQAGDLNTGGLTTLTPAEKSENTTATVLIGAALFAAKALIFS